VRAGALAGTTRRGGRTRPGASVAAGHGDDSAINLWAGEAHELARAVPARQLVRELLAEARQAARHVAGRLR